MQLVINITGMCQLYIIAGMLVRVYNGHDVLKEKHELFTQVINQH
jgi:hypothetical protein